MPAVTHPPAVSSRRISCQYPLLPQQTPLLSYADDLGRQQTPIPTVSD
jgi:hypothetical protein